MQVSSSLFAMSTFVTSPSLWADSRAQRVSQIDPMSAPQLSLHRPSPIEACIVDMPALEQYVRSQSGAAPPLDPAPPPPSAVRCSIDVPPSGASKSFVGMPLAKQLAHLSVKEGAARASTIGAWRYSEASTDVATPGSDGSVVSGGADTRSVRGSNRSLWGSLTARSATSGDHLSTKRVALQVCCVLFVFSYCDVRPASVASVFLLVKVKYLPFLSYRKHNSGSAVAFTASRTHVLPDSMQEAVPHSRRTEAFEAELQPDDQTPISAPWPSHDSMIVATEPLDPGNASAADITAPDASVDTSGTAKPKLQTLLRVFGAALPQSWLGSRRASLKCAAGPSGSRALAMAAAPIPCFCTTGYRASPLSCLPARLLFSAWSNYANRITAASPLFHDGAAALRFGARCLRRALPSTCCCLQRASSTAGCGGTTQ